MAKEKAPEPEGIPVLLGFQAITARVMAPVAVSPGSSTGAGLPISTMMVNLDGQVRLIVPAIHRAVQQGKISPKELEELIRGMVGVIVLQEMGFQSLPISPEEYQQKCGAGTPPAPLKLVIRPGGEDHRGQEAP